MFGKKKIENTKTEETTSIHAPLPDANPHEKKSRFPLVMKIISSALVLSSAAFLCYSIYLFIDDTKNSASDDAYITLNGKSIQESKNLLSMFGEEKKNKAYDYAVLGDKFFLSETKITPSVLDGSATSYIGEGKNNLFLYNLTTNQSKFDLGSTDIKNHQYYFDLSVLDEGDYLIYSDEGSFSSLKDYNPYSLSCDKTIHYETYTLPNEDGIRKRITLRNNKESPYTILNVKKCGSTLPTKNYDLVVFQSEYDSSLNKIEDNDLESYNKARKTIEETYSSKYKIKFASSMQEAYDTNATLSISLTSENMNYMSVYAKKNSSFLDANTLSGTLLAGYDKNPEIRELSGYIGRAGENLSSVKGNDTITHSDSHIGKDSYLISQDETLITKINQILSNR